MIHNVKSQTQGYRLIVFRLGKGVLNKLKRIIVIKKKNHLKSTLQEKIYAIQYFHKYILLYQF